MPLVHTATCFLEFISPVGTLKQAKTFLGGQFMVKSQGLLSSGSRGEALMYSCDIARQDILCL
jgi:hypothetical protein